MQVTLKFSAAPPPSGSTFDHLKVVLTDAAGALKTVNVSQAQIASDAVLQPDGTYLLPVTFTNVGVGPYTVTAQAINSGGIPFGPIASGSGTVSLTEGVWYASPTAFV